MDQKHRALVLTPKLCFFYKDLQTLNLAFSIKKKKAKYYIWLIM